MHAADLTGCDATGIDIYSQETDVLGLAACRYPALCKTLSLSRKQERITEQSNSAKSMMCLDQRKRQFQMLSVTATTLASISKTTDKQEFVCKVYDP